MTLRYSTYARNFMAGYGSFKDAFQNGRIEIYSGTQPTTADAAVTGTLLCTITDNSLTRVYEVCSYATLTLTGGASGSVDSIQVNSVELLGLSVPFNTSLTQTAADVAAQINVFRSSVEYYATSAGAVVTITTLPSRGTTINGQSMTVATTTITQTSAAFTGGVVGSYGLKFGSPSAATISKLPVQAWTGINVASGTAGWYRMYGSVADSGGTDTNLQYIREDGAIATSAAELNMASIALVYAATTTITSWDRTLPTQ
jgi:hypothetical protein